MQIIYFFIVTGVGQLAFKTGPLCGSVLPSSNTVLLYTVTIMLTKCTGLLQIFYMLHAKRKMVFIGVVGCLY